MFKIVVVLFLSAFLLVIGLRPAHVAAATDSKTTFEGKCGTCHGVDGKGNQKLAKALKIDESKLDLVDDETSAKSDVQLATIVRDGVDKSIMKGYKDKLSGEEIAGLIKHVRSLKK